MCYTYVPQFTFRLEMVSKIVLHRKGRTDRCSKCHEIKETKARYCRKCKNEWMREWRKTHRLDEFQRARANTRSHTKMLVKRGNLVKQPCEICSSIEVQAHHEDYNDPYNVHWLCVKCHREHHIEQSYDQWKRKQLTLNIPEPNQI